MSGVSGTVLNQKNQIQINNVPVAIKPINLHVTDISLTSAHIRWNAPAYDVDLWHIGYKEADATEWIETNCGPSTTYRLLTGLDPRKNYDVRLRMVMGSDLSEWAETSFSTDLKPTNISAEEVTYNSATIVWDGPGTMWDLQYKPSDETAWKGVMGLAEQRYQMTELKEGTSYDIRVRLTDGSDNYGNWQEESFFVPERYPAPNDLNVMNASLTSASLAWDEMGTATAWQICVNGDEENLINVDTTNAQFDGYRVKYLLSHLEVGTMYVVKVRAVYPEDNAYSEWSYDMGFVTLNPNPTPYEIAAKAEKNSATLTWKGEGDSYKVNYRKGTQLLGQDFDSGMGSWMTKNLSSSSTISYDGSFSFSYFGAPGLQYIISPELTDVPEGATLTFEHHSWGVQNKFKVGYSTTSADVEDATAFTWSDELGTNDWDWHTYTQTLPAGVKYIAIQCISDDVNDQYANLYIDNIFVNDETAEPAEWQTIETTKKQATLTDLQEGAVYEFTITSCKDGYSDSSTETKFFQTTKGTATGEVVDIEVAVTPTTANISWQSDYDMYIVQYRTAGFDVEEEQTSTFFTEDFETDLSKWWTYNMYVNSDRWSSEVGVDKSAAFDFEAGGSYPEQYLISNVLSDIPEGAELNFSYKGWNGYDGSGLSVGYSTTEYDAYTFLSSYIWNDIFDDATDPGETWKNFSVTLPADVKYIAFRWSGANGHMTIDNISITKTTTVTKHIDAGTWQMQVANEPKVQLTGLEKGTTYDYKISGLTGGSVSVETSIMQFTTPENAIDIALDAKGENQSIISANSGAYANVTLQNYTLAKDGQWHTICLPFDVDVESSALAGADIREFADAKINYSSRFTTLDFTTPVTQLKAGTPYLIRWTEDADVENPVFEGVTLIDGLSSVVRSSEVTFIPVYDFLTLPDYTWNAFALGTPELQPMDDGDEVNAFSCYFTVQGDYGYYADTHIVYTGEEDDLITGLTSVSKAEKPAIYTTDGIRIDRVSKTGIYIVGGKKKLIRVK